MTMLFGKLMSRAEVSSYVGNMKQLGGHREIEMGEGRERGVRVIEVSTGPCDEYGRGLAFDVVVDRGADIGGAWFGDTPISWLSRTGYTQPTEAVHGGMLDPKANVQQGLEWLRGFFGGLVTTCGPYNTGGPCLDYAGREAEGKLQSLGLHDRYSNTEAVVLGKASRWNGDDYVTQLDFEIAPGTKVFSPPIVIRRSVISELGIPGLTIQDEVTNEGNVSTPHEYLLHCQAGWPLLAPGAVIVCPAKSVTPRDDPLSQAYFANGRDYRTVPAPLDDHRGGGEAFAYFDVADDGGLATAGVVNKALGLGLRFDWNKTEFGRCGQWHHLGPGEYTMGIEPLTSGVTGRDNDRKEGTLLFLEPGETREYQFTASIITDPAVLQGFLALNQ